MPHIDPAIRAKPLKTNWIRYTYIFIFSSTLLRLISLQQIELRI